MIFKDRSSQCRSFYKFLSNELFKKGVNYKAEALSIHKWIFTHEGLSAHAHNIVQEVEVHGWLLSGIEEDYTLLLFFDSCS